MTEDDIRECPYCGCMYDGGYGHICPRCREYLKWAKPAAVREAERILQQALQKRRYP